MSVRVNLLRPEEIRLQTAVSRDFLVKGGVTFAVAAAVLGLVLGVLQYFRINASHKNMEARWAVLEPKFEEGKKIRDQCNTNVRILGELEAWSKSRINWLGPLESLQHLAPTNLQFTRLAINGDVKISSEEPNHKAKPGTPVRLFAMRLEGQAVGTLSDQDVISFVDKIRGSDQFSPWVASVKLQGMQLSKFQVDDGEEGVRVFRIHANSKERMMK